MRQTTSVATISSGARLLVAMLLMAALCSSCQLRPSTEAKEVAAWHFESDPASAGWERGGTYPGTRNDFDGAWSPTGGVDDSGCLLVRKGLWQTPPIPVQPGDFYRIHFAARAEGLGFHAFRFFTADGKELASDEHSSIDPAPQWQQHEAFTQARQQAATMRLAFIPPDGGPATARELWIDDVIMAQVSEAVVLAGIDRLYQSLPPVRMTPPPERWQHLAATRLSLQRGGELRVLLLGDSIANDMGNSQFHLLVQRLYPGARIHLTRSIRGGTGCTYYQHHVQAYVVDHTPELVIIAGISHSYNALAIRKVIEETRRLMTSPVEFLVLTGAILEPGMNIGYKRQGLDSPPPEVRQKAVEQEREFHAELVQLGNELVFATLDMRTIWEAYLAESGKPLAWFQRDFVHANARGKQILGRIMEQLFSPMPE